MPVRMTRMAPRGPTGLAPRVGEHLGSQQPPSTAEPRSNPWPRPPPIPLFKPKLAQGHGDPCLIRAPKETANPVFKPDPAPRPAIPIWARKARIIRPSYPSTRGLGGRPGPILNRPGSVRLGGRLSWGRPRFERWMAPYRCPLRAAKPVFKPIGADGAPRWRPLGAAQVASIPVFKPDPGRGRHLPFWARTSDVLRPSLAPGEPEGASLGVPADCPLLAWVDDLAAECLDAGERLTDVSDGEVR